MIFKNANKAALQIHGANVKNGFYNDAHLDGFFEHQLLEICKELAEFSEAHKKQNFANVQDFEDDLKDYFQDVEIDFENPIHLTAWKSRFESQVKDSAQDETADTVIRCFDLAGYKKYDIFAYAYPKFENLNTYSVSKYIFNIQKRIFQLHEAKQKLKQERLLCEVIGMLEELSHELGYDLEKHIQLKLQYNATRGKLHGKSY